MAEEQLITAHAWGELGLNHLLMVAAALGVCGVTTFPRGEKMLTALFAAKWFGHGRATECYLALVAFLYGALLTAVPGAAFASRATVDIPSSYGAFLGVPLLIMAVLSGCGLVLNIVGGQFSRALRFSGGLLGAMIWAWLAVKFFAVDAVASVGFPFCAVAAVFSIRIMAMAWAGLPRGAAPGHFRVEAR